MTRRDWVATAASALSVTGRASSAPAAEARPNILLIISDQFRADNLGCLGVNPMDLTPNLDALAARGVLFRSAMANQPVCAPARATMFTGQYPERTGVWHNGPGLKPDAVTLASTLRQEGYTANYIGKWHLGPQSGVNVGAVPPPARGGFLDFWEASNALERTSTAYSGEMYDGDGKPIPFSGTYRAQFLTDRATRFLREKRNREKPFLLCVSYLEVHHQNDVDRFLPPKEYVDRYQNPFVPQDLRPLPGTWPSQLADYYRCVKSIDDQVGHLRQALADEGLDRNTIIVFLSDHGCHFKTRNTEYKRSPHESSIHIPLIMSGPGFDRPAVVQELVSQVDLAPTLIEAAGVAVPSTMQGKSMLPLVRGDAANWRNEVYIQMSEFMTGRILRTPQFTYAVAAPKLPGWKPVPRADRYQEYMVYDLYADPFQHVNLAGRVEIKDISHQLRQRLMERIHEASGVEAPVDPCTFPYV